MLFSKNLLFITFQVLQASQCKKPVGAKSYSSEKMEGFWYEIARMQTAGGGAFQIGSVC